ACSVAFTLFRTPTKISRVRSTDYLSKHTALFASGAIPVDVIIGPEQLVTRNIEQLIANPGSLQVLDFAEGRIRLVAVRAVLPSGLDQIYPSRHRQLAANIAKAGAVISEFPLGTPPRKHHFHRRNRTLSGFSTATLVIEAGRPSGTLITASAAADQGRDVMTLPWSIYHPEGAGCRYLLDAGATLIQSPEDLAHCLNIAMPPQWMTHSAGYNATAVPAQPPALSLDQREVLSLLGRESHPAEALALRLNWDMDRCLACLSALEVQGWIQRGAKGYGATR
ncbi:DNA-processing protein DprA, partial [Luminiphilus sp.]|nr:DNA-processing protein DprA [Luminiphilus sp.]